MEVIKCKSLSKTFDSGKGEQLRALNNVDISIVAGKIYGILGHNGAGKSTLLKILSTQLLRTEGIVKIFGDDIESNTKNIQQRIGFIEGGESGLYPWLSPIQMLQYFGCLYNVSFKLISDRIYELLARVGLEKSAWHRPCGSLSKGMKQKVHFAKGLIHDPDILFLDEPTIGLDITTLSQIRELISELSKEGKTIIITSHNMNDIESLCEHIFILKSGEIVFDDSLTSLKGCFKTFAKVRLNKQLNQEYHDNLSYFGEIFDVSNDGLDFSINLESHSVSDLLQFFSSESQFLESINISEESLEDFYRKFVGNQEIIK